MIKKPFAALVCLIWLVPACFERWAEAGEKTTPSNYLEADKLFEMIQSSEAAFSKRCLQDLSKASTGINERMKRAERDVKRELGPRPEYWRIPPEVTALVCDERVPYIKVTQFLADLHRRNPPENWEYDDQYIEDNRTSALNYYSCLAVTQDSAAACDPLRSIPLSTAPIIVPAQCRDCRREPEPFQAESISDAERCERNKDAILLAKALISGGPAAERTCLEICRRVGVGILFAVDHKLGDAQSCPLACAAAVARRNEPERFCPAVLPAVDNHPMAVKACRDKGFPILVGLGNGMSQADMLAMVENPDPGQRPCARDQPCFEIQDVVAYSSFRKAFSAKNKALCGDSMKCLAMMGESSRLCEPIADAARREVCGQQENLRRRDAWDREHAAALKKIDDMRAMIDRYRDACAEDLNRMKIMYDKIGNLLSSPPIYPSQEPRAQKLRKSWNRFNEMDEKFKKLNNPSSPPPPL